MSKKDRRNCSTRSFSFPRKGPLPPFRKTFLTIPLAHHDPVSLEPPEVLPCAPEPGLDLVGDADSAQLAGAVKGLLQVASGELHRTAHSLIFLIKKRICTKVQDARVIVLLPGWTPRRRRPCSCPWVVCT